MSEEESLGRSLRGDERIFDEEALEAARVLFARDCRFLMGAAKVEQLPDDPLPEIAGSSRSSTAMTWRAPPTSPAAPAR